MAKKVQKKKTAVKPAAPSKPKDFLDMAAPLVVKFNTDQAIKCARHVQFGFAQGGGLPDRPRGDL